MNAKQLRDSILQMAMEGKLVPQLDSEGVVEQIGPAPDEVPFEIPASWKWVRIELITSSAKQNKPMKMFTYIDVSSINNFTPSLINIIQADQAPSRARKIVKEGMVLYSMTRPYLMNTCIVPKLSNYTIASTAFAAVNCQDCLLNKYLLFILISKYFNSYVTKHQHGSSYPAINQKQFNNAYIPLPPLEEQKRIVAKLEQLMPLVDDFGKAYDELEELNSSIPNKLKASILQYAMEGKLVPQLESEGEVEQLGNAPDEVPFEIPASWKWVLFKECAKVNPKITLSDDTLVSFIPMVDVEGGYNNSIFPKEVQPWSQAKKGHSQFIDNDILMAKVTPCFENRKSCIAKGLKNGVGAGSTELLVIRANEQSLAPYLLFFLKSFYLIEYGVKHFTGSTGLKRFGASDLNLCPIPLPPLDEQKRIVAKVEALFDQIDLMVG